MSGRPALDINKLMEARPFSTNHSSLSRRWSLRSLYTCYVSFKEIDSLPRIGESVSSSFPRYVLHQQIHCQGMVDHLWLQMHWNPPRHTDAKNSSTPTRYQGFANHCPTVYLPCAKSCFEQNIALSLPLNRMLRQVWPLGCIAAARKALPRACALNAKHCQGLVQWE